jgi:hypothetical protein
MASLNIVFVEQPEFAIELIETCDTFTIAVFESEGV